MNSPKQLRLWSDTEIDVARAARILNTSEQTVRRLIESGALRAYRLTDQGWWRVSFESVADYLDKIRDVHSI